MDDLLNLLHLQDDDIMKGVYYNRRPALETDEGITFKYDILYSRDTSYNIQMEGLRMDANYQTIKTSDLQTVKVGAYCALQDGGLWAIEGIVKKPAKDENKQILRLFTESANPEYVLRLREVDNPWGL